MCTIGVFDSGIGGITTLRSVMEMCGRHRYVYFMDDLNCPYGSRSESEIRRFLYAGCEFLESAGADMAVIACNTATAVGVEEVRRAFDMPVIGIEPAVKQAHGKTVLLATPVTLKQRRIKKLCEKNGFPEMRAAESLAGIIQKNPDFPEAAAPLIDQLLWDGAEFDSIVLGCTHYVLARNYIAEKFPYAHVLDGNDGVARRARDISGNYSFDKKGVLLHCTSENADCYKAFFEKFLSIDEVDII